MRCGHLVLTAARAQGGACKPRTAPPAERTRVRAEARLGMQLADGTLAQGGGRQRQLVRAGVWSLACEAARQGAQLAGRTPALQGERQPQ